MDVCCLMQLPTLTLISLWLAYPLARAAEAGTDLRASERGIRPAPVWRVVDRNIFEN